MNEDFATRAWADNHATLSTGIARGIRRFLDGMDRLNARKFDSPWHDAALRRDCTAR